MGRKRFLASLLALMMLALGSGGEVRSSMSPGVSDVANSSVVAQPEPGHAETPATTVFGGTPGQQVLMTWALSRYEEEGLVLPPLQIHLHEDRSRCKGHNGLFSPSPDPWRVTVCNEERTTMLHELGHAWTERNLNERERSDFVIERNMETWDSPGTSWGARGRGCCVGPGLGSATCGDPRNESRWATSRAEPGLPDADGKRLSEAAELTTPVPSRCQALRLRLRRWIPSRHNLYLQCSTR